jgi:Ca-activated chloride channel homolog
LLTVSYWSGNNPFTEGTLIMSFHDWSYTYPQIGYLLFLVLPIFLLFRSLFLHQQWVLESLINPIHISRLSTRYSRVFFWLKGLALCLIWIFSCLALMQPKGNFKYLSRNKGSLVQKWVIPRDLIILIDTSASMSATDTRAGKSRLDTAKEIAGEIVSHLNGQNGSLHAFTSDLTTLSPPTLDYLFLTLALKGLSFNEGGTAGTDFASSLELLKKNFWGIHSNKQYAVVILSDGEDTVLEGLKGDDQKKARDRILFPLKDTLESHLRVFTIGIGSAEGAPVPDLTFQGKPVITRLHDDLLKDISLLGRGKYYSAASSSTLEILQALLDEFQADFLEAEKSEQPVLTMTQEEDISYSLYFQIPLAIALLLLSGLLMYNPKASRFLIICFLLTTAGFAQEPGDRAIAFYAIKNYPKAHEIYQEMLVKPLPAWKKAFILYNIGTTFMAKGNGNEARAYFESVLLGSDPSPLLLRYLHTNLGVNSLRQAYTLTLHTPYDVAKASRLLNDALKDFQAAFQAECVLDGECTQPHDLVEMNRVASQLFFGVDQMKRAQYIEALKQAELAYLLMEESQQAMSYAAFLKKTNIPPDKRTAYANFFYDRGHDQLPLWEKAGVPIKDLFVQGLIALKEGRIEQSFHALDETMRLLKQLGKESPQMIDKLLFRYKLALAEEPLDISDLQSLQHDQEQLLPKIPANNLLKTAIALIRKEQDAAGRFFLQGAFNELASLQTSVGSDPTSVLQGLIDLQKQAALMTTLFHKIPQPDANTAKLLQDVQKMPLHSSGAFIESSLAEQRLSYEQKSQCQSNLWESVFPVFQKGFFLGNQAFSHLTSTPPDVLGAIPLQEQAITKWDEALNALHSKQNEQEKTQKTSEPISPPMQDTINALEEMDLQDVMPQTKNPVKAERGVLPW